MSFYKSIPGAVADGKKSRLNYQWLLLLESILRFGSHLAPRGQGITELSQQTIICPIACPVLTVKERKLNYTFMLAEALWILTGSDQLDRLTPYNRKMADYSDDGVTLAGAYGPRYVGQKSYVVKKLVEDRDTRQATMTFWVPNPEPSKDIPCTIALDFKIRDNKLNLHVFMRSSDAYLGLPYDVFSFSMIALDILQCVNVAFENVHPVSVAPGKLYLTAASSHIYDRDREKALACLTDQACEDVNDVPPYLVGFPIQPTLVEAIGDSSKRWWSK